MANRSPREPSPAELLAQQGPRETLAMGAEFLLASSGEQFHPVLVVMSEHPEKLRQLHLAVGVGELRDVSGSEVYRYTARGVTECLEVMRWIASDPPFAGLMEAQYRVWADYVRRLSDDRDLPRWVGTEAATEMARLERTWPRLAADLPGAHQ